MSWLHSCVPLNLCASEPSAKSERAAGASTKISCCPLTSPDNFGVTCFSRIKSAKAATCCSRAARFAKSETEQILSCPRAQTKPDKRSDDFHEESMKLVAGLISTPHCAGRSYQTNGTRRCRTLSRYSLYPGRFLTRNRSSSKSRQIKSGSVAPTATSPQYEPSASGVPSR
jgi:hypothetical protein